MKSLKFSYFSLYLSGFLQFFEKFLQKSLEVIKKYLPLQSQTKRMGHKCGSSSVGRAQPCQGWGREFEPRLPLQKQMKVSRNADFHFEKNLPDGVPLYVSRPCAQGRLFLFYTQLTEPQTFKTTRVGKSSDPCGINMLCIRNLSNKSWLKYLLPVAICDTK